MIACAADGFKRSVYVKTGWCSSQRLFACSGRMQVVNYFNKLVQLAKAVAGLALSLGEVAGASQPCRASARVREAWAMCSQKPQVKSKSIILSKTLR